MVKNIFCVKCGDTCLVTNDVTIGFRKDLAVSCVKSCSWIMNKVCCEECLERFNKGSRCKKGELVK